MKLPPLPSIKSPDFDPVLLLANTEFYLNGQPNYGPICLGDILKQPPTLNKSELLIDQVKQNCKMDTCFRFHPIDRDSYLVINLVSQETLKAAT